MSASHRVRPITDADHDAAGTILAEAYGVFASRAPSYHAYASTPAMWVDDATEVFVAVEDATEHVVGVVVLALDGSPLHERVDPPTNDGGFRLLAVTPEARGRGIAHTLVQTCVDAARAAGTRRIGIYTMDFMESAQRLYERMGFDRRPDLDLEFPSGAGHAYTFDLVADAADHFPPPGPPADPLPWYRDAIVDADDEPPGPPPPMCGP